MSLFAKFVILLFSIMLISCAADNRPRTKAALVSNYDNWAQLAHDIIVKPEEDWQAIAIRTKIPTSILKRYNKNTKPLKVGQKILIPTREFYKVKSGETALGIAVKYGMTFSEFLHLNNIEQPYKVKNNQLLKVIVVSLPKITTYTPVKVKTISQSKKLVFSWPVNGEVTTKFGVSNNGAKNDGIKIKTKLHNKVKVTSAGIVVYVGNEIASYGNLVIIQHQGEWLSSYGNLAKIDVQKGDSVKAGQIIGNLANDTLYFGLRKANQAVNPIKYLAKLKRK